MVNFFKTGCKQFEHGGPLPDFLEFLGVGGVGKGNTKDRSGITADQNVIKRYSTIKAHIATYNKDVDI